MKYHVVVRGPLPPDLAQRIAEAHAAALKAQRQAAKSAADAKPA